jgi:hypothetical protein
MSDATTISTPTDSGTDAAVSTPTAPTAPTGGEGTLLSSAPTSTTDAQTESAQPVDKPDWLPESKFWRDRQRSE